MRFLVVGRAIERGNWDSGIYWQCEDLQKFYGALGGYDNPSEKKNRPVAKTILANKEQPGLLLQCQLGSSGNANTW